MAQSPRGGGGSGSEQLRASLLSLNSREGESFHSPGHACRMLLSNASLEASECSDSGSKVITCTGLKEKKSTKIMQCT